MSQAKANQEPMNFSNEMEQMLLLIEKLGDVARLFIQDRQQKQVMDQKNAEAKKTTEPEQGANKKQQATETPKKQTENADLSFQSPINQEVVKQLEAINQEFIIIRKSMMEKINGAELDQEVQDDPKPTMEQQLIERDVEKLDKDISTLEQQTDQLKKTPKQSIERVTLLKAIGAGLIAAENRRLALGDKVKHFFKTLPNQIELKFSKGLINMLENLKERVNTLNHELMQEVKPENQVQAVAEKSEVNENVEVKASDYPRKSNQLIDEMGQKLDELKLSLNEEYALAQKNQVEAQKKQAEEKLTAQKLAEQKLAEQKAEAQKVAAQKDELIKEKVVGVQTELVPDAGLMESLNQKETQGIETTAAVKNELEDVTMTDYGETMEDAYRHGNDPDPDVSAYPTEAQMQEDQDRYGGDDNYDGYGYDEDYDELER
ncbi:hypothetical protein [Acetobacterium woodii]|uniref:Uncharacterized protein n=1 Tax=Acetobacterium woodii (strain ATCC 29683 / DSM 1030 / JCM 2381 / KCTC 1655 / WB1) TaxID=931626 RepID=H6LDG0_ACEWD|nr:hypothetical protein [Acetobacterium woodii]AFA47932.1 hypothetical protein Awo_c11480 [Acetobacterium woodii DSM 1030]